MAKTRKQAQHCGCPTCGLPVLGLEVKQCLICASAPLPPTHSVAQRIAWMHSTGLFDARGNYIVSEVR